MYKFILFLLLVSAIYTQTDPPQNQQPEKQKQTVSTQPVDQPEAPKTNTNNQTLNITSPPTPQIKPSETTPKNVIPQSQQPEKVEPQTLVGHAKSQKNVNQPKQIQPEIVVHEVVPQPSPVIEAQVNGQQVHYQKTKQDQVIELENYKTQSININYEHVKTYSFEIVGRSSFAIKVDHDVEVKGVFTIYWDNGESYAESRYELGQDVGLTIYQNHSALLFSDNCYRTNGFKFFARKGYTYNINFMTQGKKKLISMLMQNYLTQRKGAEKLHSEHANQHELQTEKIKNTLRTFLNVVEKNFMMNQQIAYNVTLHSKRYLSYQIIQMILIVLGACTQIYLIKRLLNPHSVV